MSRPAKGPRLKPREDRGGVYYIYWTDPVTGRTRELGTGKTDQAEATRDFADWLAKQQHTAVAAEWNGPRNPSEVKIIDAMTLYADEHVAVKTPSAAGKATAGQAIEILTKWWGDNTVDAITLATCRAYRADRVAGALVFASTRFPKGKPAAVSTVARELVVLRAAVRYAEKAGRLTKAPFVEVPTEKEQPPPRDVWLTRSQVAKLLWECRREKKARDHLVRFVYTALITGARPGAIFDLRWFPQINFTTNRIDFEPPGRARTNKERPKQPIPRRLRWFMERWFARATSPWVISYDGKQVKSVKKAFRAARIRAGLGPEVTPYTMRHTCATWQGHAGVDLRHTGDWLGHKDPRTTKRYQHHHDGYLEEARKVMD